MDTEATKIHDGENLANNEQNPVEAETNQDEPEAAQSDHTAINEPNQVEVKTNEDEPEAAQSDHTAMNEPNQVEVKTNEDQPEAAPSDHTAINKSNQVEVATNKDQPEAAPKEYLPPGVRNHIEHVVESKGIKDYKILIEPGSAIGDNFMGFIGKVTVTGVDKDKENTTLNWIVKAAPQNDYYRKMMKAEVIYKREVYVYETVFPNIATFQEEKSIIEPFNNYPKFVFSNLEQYQESFGMENVKNKGYVMRNRQEPLNFHHVKLLMKTYAKFHAVSLAMKDQKPEEFAELGGNMKDVMGEMAMSKEETDKIYKPMLDAAFNSLNPNTDQVAIRKFEKFMEDYWNIFNNALNRTNQYSVLGHGDSWVNNMLWKYDDPSDQTKPTDVCLLDFQLARYASPVCDLSYFLYTCTEKSLRDKHYDEAIKLYYYTLCLHLTELGSDPEKMFSFSALQEELKLTSVAGMFYSVLVLGIIIRNVDEIPDMKKSDITEDEVSSTFSKQSKNQDRYNQRARGIIIDVCERGYLDFLD